MTLHVTRIAKWKTTAQLVSIGTLLAVGILEMELQIAYHQMDPFQFEQIVTGQVDDGSGLRMTARLFDWTYVIGLALLWIAALLTAISGWDYFAKARPYLADAEDRKI